MQTTTSPYWYARATCGDRRRMARVQVCPRRAWCYRHWCVERSRRYVQTEPVPRLRVSRWQVRWNDLTVVDERTIRRWFAEGFVSRTEPNSRRVRSIHRQGSPLLSLPDFRRHIRSSQRGRSANRDTHKCPDPAIVISVRSNREPRAEGPKPRREALRKRWSGPVRPCHSEPPRKYV